MRFTAQVTFRYWDTDVTGSGGSDWEFLHLKPIYFPENWVGNLGAWKYKVAIGGELIIDFGNEDKGSGKNKLSRIHYLLVVRIVKILPMTNARKNRM